MTKDDAQKKADEVNANIDLNKVLCPIRNNRCVSNCVAYRESCVYSTDSLYNFNKHYWATDIYCNYLKLGIKDK